MQQHKKQFVSLMLWVAVFGLILSVAIPAIYQAMPEPYVNIYTIDDEWTLEDDHTMLEVLQ